MPAVQPARLKQQAALLGQHLDDPPAFVRSLHHLLDFYADRTHRPGLSGEPASLVESYNAPAPVVRLILQTLAGLVAENPLQAQTLCDVLWRQPYLEFRQLAVGILDKLPVEPPEPVLNRAQVWAEKAEDQRMIDLVLDNGLAHLRQENPAALLGFLEFWLNDNAVMRQKLGLRALKFLVAEPAYQNLPVFFRLLQSLMRETPPALRLEVVDVCRALAQRSPQETAYFLSQGLKSTHSSDTAWLIRQLYDEFPPEIESQLRTTVRAMTQRS
ncbi:MAG TPA: DNA alkylation repair protein [Anaerolineales bacterium]|nr:DNA alkylation repair protein [Anaerolineales bacterium]